jgi:hypothetical protein
MNNQLPINRPLFPNFFPGIAEIFSISLLAATYYLMDLQVEWHGKPVNSRFYETFLVKGGYPSGYLCSKYLKLVLSNMILIAVFILVVFGQRF